VVHLALEKRTCVRYTPVVSAGAPSPAAVGQGPLAAERVLPAPEALRPFLPAGGIQRGTVVGVSGPGGVTLALSLLVDPLAVGSWAAVVGLPELGMEAAAAMGVDIGRIALVPDPGGSWGPVTAVLLDALDVVVLRPPGRSRPADARRLGARARQRGSVLMVLDGPRAWPERPDLELVGEVERWEGLGTGWGTLRRRRGAVVISGRRVPARPLTVACWLPGPEGRLAARAPKVASLAAPDVRDEAEAIAWAG
jgi:hypothetical protein